MTKPRDPSVHYRRKELVNPLSPLSVLGQWEPDTDDRQGSRALKGAADPLYIHSSVGAYAALDLPIASNMIHS